MALPPNIANYTIPGGIKLYFDDGTGERDLGNIADVDAEPGADELRVFSNRSGKRMLDALFSLEDKLAVNFKLKEPVAENLRYFFTGGAISSVGAGTGTVTDQELTLEGLLLASVGAYYGLSAVTVRQFLDFCKVYDGSAYTDNSVEADSLDGVAFTTLVDGSYFLYLGKLTQFQEIYIDFATPGVYGAVVWEYWDGSAWQTLSVSGAADGLDADGKVNWTIPVDWATTLVDGDSAYWIRSSATTPWTTPATINEIRQNAVVNVDYVLDAGQAGAEGRLPGRIGRLAGGFLADGEEVKVSFTYTTWTSMKFAIAGSAFIQGAARLEVHPSSGRGLQFDVVIPKCIIKPKGAVPLGDDKLMEVPMMLEALDNSSVDPSYPFGYVLHYET